MKKYLLLCAIFTHFFLSECNVFSHEYELCICAITNGEGKYLPEWIEFHQRQGVEHFYIYSHFNEEEDLEYLYPYVDDGLVEIIKWNHPYENHKFLDWIKIQCNAYMDCAKKIDSHWCAFIDTDEFLFSPIHPDLRFVLSNYDDFPGVTVNWVVYGTSNIDDACGEITRQLLYRSELDYNDNRAVKTIAQPDLIRACNTPHCFIYKEGNAVDERFRLQNIDNTVNHSSSILRINHYTYRDQNFLRNVKLRRAMKFGVSPKKILDAEAKCNEVFDPILMFR